MSYQLLIAAQNERIKKWRLGLVILAVLGFSFLEHWGDGSDAPACGVPSPPPIHRGLLSWPDKLDRVVASERTARWLHPIISKIGYRRFTLRTVSIVALEAEIANSATKLPSFKDNCQAWAVVTKLVQLLRNEKAAAVVIADTLPPCADEAIREDFARAATGRVFLGRTVSACTLSDSLPIVAGVEEGILTEETDPHHIPLKYFVSRHPGEKAVEMKSLPLAVVDSYDHDISGSAGGAPGFEDNLPPYTIFVDRKDIRPISSLSLVCQGLDWTRCQAELLPKTARPVEHRNGPRRSSVTERFRNGPSLAPIKASVFNKKQRSRSLLARKRSLPKSSHTMLPDPLRVMNHGSPASSSLPIEATRKINGHIVVIGFATPSTENAQFRVEANDRTVLQAIYVQSLLDGEYFRPVTLKTRLLCFAALVSGLVVVFWRSQSPWQAFCWSLVALVVAFGLTYWAAVQFGCFILSIWNLLASILGLVTHLFLERFLKEKPMRPTIWLGNLRGT